MAKQQQRTIKSGGGLTSNKLVTKREATREAPRVRRANPAAVADIGSMKGNHAENRDLPYKARALRDGNGFQPVPLGNAKATDVGAGGPGKGRTVHRSGSQGQHGPVAGQPKQPGRGIN